MFAFYLTAARNATQAKAVKVSPGSFSQKSQLPLQEAKASKTLAIANWHGLMGRSSSYAER